MFLLKSRPGNDELASKRTRLVGRRSRISLRLTVPVNSASRQVKLVLKAHNMRLAVLVCFLALAATALGQLNYDKSYFLYTPTHGTLTLTSMYLPSLRTYNFTMPPYSPDIGIQSLTDISNSRFIVWSGNDLGAQGVNYTVRPPIRAFCSYFVALHSSHHMVSGFLDIKPQNTD